MRITLKTLKNEQFPIEVEENWSVLKLKEEIFKQFNHETTWQKLIYAGKILEDSQTISSYGIKDSDFLVIMVRKPATTISTPNNKPNPVQPNAPTQTQPTQTQQQQPPVTPISNQTQPNRTSSPNLTPTTPPTTTETTTSASTLALGSEYERLVSQICDMGFPREEVQKAMQAAFNNPDRAVEYLMNGIPEGLPTQAINRPPPTTSTTTTTRPPTGNSGTPTRPATTGTTAAVNPTIPSATSGNLFEMAAAQAAQRQTTSTGSGQFDFLKQHPQFNMLRQLVQQQPHLLGPVLQQLGASNPQILQLINQNQEEFIRLLNEPIAPGTPTSNVPGSPGTPPGGGTYIQLTAEENEQILRLQSMGFSKQAVLEAWLACDRDESLAANYLLENASEYVDDGGAEEDYGDEDMGGEM